MEGNQKEDKRAMLGAEKDQETATEVPNLKFIRKRKQDKTITLI